MLLNSSELVSIGKQGMLYVIPYNASSNTYMGGLDGCGYSCSSGSSPTATACTESGAGSILQCFPAVPYNISFGDFNGLRGSPTFWAGAGSNLLYLAGVRDALVAYSLVGSTFNMTASTASTPATYGFPGGMTSVSWNGLNSSSGLLWALEESGAGNVSYSGGSTNYKAATPAILYVYTAVPSGGKISYLWDSSKLPNPTTAMPGAVKFVMPTVSDGYVFIAGGVPAYFGTGTTGCPSGTTFTCQGQLTILH